MPEEVNCVVGGGGFPKTSQKCCSKTCSNKLRYGDKYKDTLHNKEWLYAKYITDKLSLTTIGESIGSTAALVRRALKSFNIDIRSISEGRKTTFNQRGRQFVGQQELIDAYGGECQCCGEKIPEFLTLDHIGGGGGAHRKAMRATGKNPILGIRQELKAAGWPKDKYRLLCMNCNHATRLGKPCPHQLNKQPIQTTEITINESVSL